MRYGNYLSEYAEPTEACWDSNGNIAWERNGRPISPMVRNHYLDHERLPDWVVKDRKTRKTTHLKSAIPLDKTIYLSDEKEIREIAKSLGLSVRKDTLVSTGVLLANLYQLVCLDVTNCLSLSMDNTRWNKNHSDNPLGVTSHICKQVKRLERNDWVIRYRGFKNPATGKGYNSVIVVKEKLVELLNSHDSLQLKISSKASIRRKSLLRDEKTGKRNSLPIDESFFPTHVIETQKILETYNQFINEQQITIDNPYKKTFNDLIAFHCNYYGEGYELQSRIIGGRYQNIPKDLRKDSLRINGEKAVEIDIVESHPTILYALAGKPLKLNEIGKSYWLDDVEPSEDERDEVKKSFSILLNSSSREKAIAAVRYAQNSGDISATFSPQQLVCKLESRHKAISHLFYRQDVGLRCMHYEGILMIKLLSEAVKLRIVCLPLHDAVISTEPNKIIVAQLLRNEFNEVLTAECRVNFKEL